MKNESKIYIRIKNLLKKTRRLDILFSTLAIVFLFSIPILLSQFVNIDENKLGVYGDFFGSINAFVSALAFAGLIYTIILQRKDLRLQREELQLTREELKRQATAQEYSANEQAAQVELLKEQINKDIRPYINAYWEFRNHEIILSIKNNGKCACSDFQIKCKSINAEKLSPDYNDALDDLIQRIENLKISTFPSSIEYNVAITNIFISKVSGIQLLRELRIQEVSLICDFSFIFRKQIEPFSITYDFKSMELFENENTTFQKNLITELQDIKKALKQIKIK